MVKNVVGIISKNTCVTKVKTKPLRRFDNLNEHDKNSNLTCNCIQMSAVQPLLSNERGTSNTFNNSPPFNLNALSINGENATSTARGTTLPQQEPLWLSHFDTVRTRVSEHGWLCCVKPSRDFHVGNTFLRLYKEHLTYSTDLNTMELQQKWSKALSASCATTRNQVITSISSSMKTIRRQDIIYVHSMDDMFRYGTQVKATSEVKCVYPCDPLITSCCCCIRFPYLLEMHDKTIPINLVLRTKPEPVTLEMPPALVNTLTQWIFADNSNQQPTSQPNMVY